MYQDKLKWSQELWRKVLLDHDPYAVLVGLTTGGDSLAAFHVARRIMKIDACFTCDTSIAAVETLKNCQDVCGKYETKWICRAPPYGGLAENPNTYFELVKRHGFPGKTPTAHSWMYQYLKDHTVARIVSSIRKRKRKRCIVIISGARKHESVRRMGTSQDITFSKSTNAVWVNIVNEWTDQEISDFKHDADIDKERSPISKMLGISGECFCGSYAKPGDKLELKIASPSTYEKLQGIADWLKANTGMSWGWDESPPSGHILEKHGQLNMFSPQMLFCSTCMNNRSPIESTL